MQKFSLSFDDGLIHMLFMRVVGMSRVQFGLGVKACNGFFLALPIYVMVCKRVFLSLFFFRGNMVELIPVVFSARRKIVVF